jgi:hypothetical protein
MTNRGRQPEATHETPRKGLGMSFEGTKLTYDTYKHQSAVARAVEGFWSANGFAGGAAPC